MIIPKKYLDPELENKLRLGELGEKLVANYESSRGNKVFLALDPYDSNKDLWVNNLRCEVKTQVPYFSKMAFTFKESQIKKLKSVDRIYFISVDIQSDSFYYNQDYTNKVFICEEPSKLRIGKTETPFGIHAYVKISDLKPYFKITDQTAIELMKFYSSSGLQSKT